MVRVCYMVLGMVLAGCGHGPSSRTDVDGSVDATGLDSAQEVTAAAPAIDRPQQLSAGRHATCAVREGQVWCWGGLDDCALPLASGMPKPVAGVADAVHVAVGATSACAVTVDGDVICWPLTSLYSTSPTLDPPLTRIDGLGSLTALSVGTDMCAVNDLGKLYCWVLADDGELLGPDYVDLPGPARDVDVGDSFFACAVTMSGETLCWNSGQWEVDLDEVNYAADAATLDLAIQARYVAVSAAGWCVADENGQVECWNDEPDGPDGFFNEVPAEAPDAAILGLSAGSHDYCARYDDGQALCWHASHGPAHAAPLELSSVAHLAVGTDHTCTMDPTGSVTCAGANHLGQLGLGGAADTVRLTAAGFHWPGTLQSVDAGPAMTCLVDGESALRCWGRTGLPQGEPLSGPEPDTIWTLVAAGGGTLGEGQVCGVDGDAKLWCADLTDEAADGPSWSQVSLERSPRALALGDAQQGCALTFEGPPICWERGAGTVNEVTAVGPGFESLKCQGNRCCVAGPDDGTSCFDNPASSGEATANLQTWPELLASHLAVGMDTQCVLDLAGDVWCWGFNGRCGLGVDTTMPTVAQPALVPLPAKATALAGGPFFACALLTDDRLACWGELDEACRYELDGQVGCGVGLQAALGAPGTVMAASADQLLLGEPGQPVHQLGRNQFGEVPGGWPPQSAIPVTLSF